MYKDTANICKECGRERNLLDFVLFKKRVMCQYCQIRSNYPNAIIKDEPKENKQEDYTRGIESIKAIGDLWYVDHQSHEAKTSISETVSTTITLKPKPIENTGARVILFDDD